MAARSANTNYNTNLASEYLMMSLLCRAGKDAYLSLGNKKGVDIIVKTNSGNICVIEVKGVNKNDDWLIGNSGVMPAQKNMFYALIGYEGSITDVISPAKFFLIPSLLLSREGEYKCAGNQKTIYLSHKYITANYGEYRNSFKWLDEYLENN
jgi:hypothetical protein